MDTSYTLDFTPYLSGCEYCPTTTTITVPNSPIASDE